MGTHVLVPLDRSEQAQQAFEFAIEEADADRITLLHVIDPEEATYVQGGEIDRGSSDWYDQMTQETEEFLDPYVDRIEDAGIEAETVQKVGRPSREIVTFTQENNVDHVVMGSHGRDGISRLLLGSVAETVVRRSPAPVTVIR